MVTKTHNPVVAPMKSMKRNKSGQLGGMATSILSIGVAVIVLVLTLVITQELRDTQASGTEAFEAANESVVGLGTFGDFVTIIVLALVAGIVLGIIFGVFGGVGGSGSGRRRK